MMHWHTDQDLASVASQSFTNLPRIRRWCREPIFNLSQVDSINRIKDTQTTVYIDKAGFGGGKQKLAAGLVSFIHSRQ